jgi:chromate reductase
MKILMFAASLRKDSLNKKLIRNAQKLLPMGHEVMLKEFNEFMVPLYDGDIESSTGVPEAAKKLSELITQVDAVIISSPEYNFGIPGTFKNLIDWTSRVKPTPWAGKQVFLMGASPGMVGTNRGLWQVRQALEANSAHVYPDMMGVAQADKAFNATEELTNEPIKAALQKQLAKFTAYAEYVSKMPKG